jgi:hypothetical protein
MDKTTCTLTGFALLIFSGSAAAIPIQGPTDIGSNGQAFHNGHRITGIDFICGPTCIGQVNGRPGPDGDFAGLGGLKTRSGELQRHDFKYSNFQNTLPSQVFRDIDYGGLQYGFTMTGLGVVSADINNDPNCRGTQDFGCLVLAGTGIFSITAKGSNYTDAAGNWVYSQTGTRFPSQNTALPEPGTIALLGLGLVGFGIIRYLRKAA